MTEKDPRNDLLQAGRDAAKKIVKGGLSEVGESALAFPSLWFSTGSLALDRICRGYNPGGLPAGRVVHIPGDWSTGKTLVLDHLFKSCIDVGGLGLRSETEGTSDKHFADAIQLDLTKVEIQRPETIETLVDMGLAWHDAMRGKPAGKTIPIIWGIDSLDSTEAEKSAKAGLSQSHGWQYGGGRSEALAAGLRKIIQRTCRYPTTVVMLNQIRENVGVMFGPDKRSALGNPPHFYASLEIWLSGSPLGYERGPAGTLKLTKEARKRLGFREKDPGDVIGRWVRAKITKTKVAPTMMQEADFYIDFRKGVHKWGGLFSLLLRQQVIETDPEAKEVKHGDERFPDTRTWLGWLSKHMEVLGKKEE